MTTTLCIVHPFEQKKFRRDGMEILLLNEFGNKILLQYE